MIIQLLLFISTLGAAEVQDTRDSWNPFITENGYQLGYLVDAGSKGLIVNTFEGSLKLGNDSSIAYVRDEVCYQRELSKINPQISETAKSALLNDASVSCREQVSPWRFSSFNTELVKNLQNLDHTAILVYFKRYKYYPITDTDSIVESVQAVDPNAPLSQKSMNVLDRYWFSKHLKYQTGFKDGRFAKASLSGYIRDHYTLLMQLGDSGNIFMRLNVDYKDLYEFIVQCMATGRLLRVHFIQLYSVAAIPQSIIFGYNTDYRVYQVDVLDQKMEKE